MPICVTHSRSSVTINSFCFCFFLNLIRLGYSTSQVPCPSPSCAAESQSCGGPMFCLCAGLECHCNCSYFYPTVKPSFLFLALFCSRWFSLLFSEVVARDTLACAMHFMSHVFSCLQHTGKCHQGLDPGLSLVNLQFSGCSLMAGEGKDFGL